MRKLTTIPGILIILFLVSGIEYYTGIQRIMLAWGTMFMAVVLIVIKIKPGGKKKKMGYILRG